jgi:hypothetical protein
MSETYRGAGVGSLSAAIEEVVEGSYWIRSHDRETRAETRREVAEKIENELVCCDVYDRLNPKPRAAWSSVDESEFRGHSICYWGRAAARIADSGEWAD